MEMAHGTDTGWTPFLGVCLTDDEYAATDYATDRAGWDTAAVVHWVSIDLDNLTVIEVDGYDPIDNIAAGDRDDRYDADVIVYDDQTIAGRTHRTWRIMSPRALGAIEYLTSEEAQ